MRRGFRPRLVCLTAAICLLSALIGRAHVDRAQSAPAPPADFPPGPNRDVVVKACKECHPISQVTRRRESRSKWSGIVEQMIKEGAEIRDEDFDKIVVYLSVVLGKNIRINDATAEAISEALDIAEEAASAIVKHRAEKGPFKEWKDLLKVPGIDAQRIEEMKDALDFSPAA
jgi:competence ComEA-like helix-hairpin-helix protein